MRNCLIKQKDSLWWGLLLGIDPWGEHSITIGQKYILFLRIGRFIWDSKEILFLSFICEVTLKWNVLWDWEILAFLRLIWFQTAYKYKGGKELSSGCSSEGYCLPFGCLGGEASVHLIDHAHCLNFIFLLSIIHCSSKLIFFSLKTQSKDMRKI